MARKSPCSFLVIFAFFVGSSLLGVSTALGGRKALSADIKVSDVIDAFVGIDPNDSKVVEIAKFAIDEYNKQQSVVLSFNRVVQAASSDDPQGTTYSLIVEAKDASGSNDYDADVIVNKDGTKKLIAFRKRN